MLGTLGPSSWTARDVSSRYRPLTLCCRLHDFPAVHKIVMQTHGSVRLHWHSAKSSPCAPQHDEGICHSRDCASRMTRRPVPSPRVRVVLRCMRLLPRWRSDAGEQPDLKPWVGAIICDCRIGNSDSAFSASPNHSFLHAGSSRPARHGLGVAVYCLLNPAP